MAKDYTYSELVETLHKVGIGNGDIVHVHSALFSLGTLEGVPLRDTPLYVYRAIRELIGPTGTLTVPTAFEDYARFGTPYDCRRSPVDRAQGVFSQYIASLSESVRTYCPMCSVTAIGPLATEICHAWTGSAFGTDSAWEKLYHFDSKLCFLGVRPSQAFTFTVFIQFRFGVPYFYNKIYTVPIYEDGQPISLPVTCCVRYLNPAFKISENCVPFEEHLREQGYIPSESIGRGKVYNMLSAKAIFQEGAKMLKKNLYYFCKQLPQFIPGEVPMDGSTGKFIPDHIRFDQVPEQ